MKIISDPAVEETILNYPPTLQKEIRELRELILETASEIEGLNQLQETLKWGEPSYLTKRGSTIRIAVKPKTLNHYSIFFKCTTKLVPTFRILYPEIFHFEGNREITLAAGTILPKKELKHCIRLALTYHQIKHKPMLGA